MNIVAGAGSAISAVHGTHSALKYASGRNGDGGYRMVDSDDHDHGVE